ncbi:BLOC-1-related complex subunit 5-like [Artemia franciscana]|uniref:BLOC-1-related complex subunit 5 n=1 Tax=Artemia franciscana TaxID=6661 RepID=A0AA88KYM1_ARTSF|nr:hypothetical protein QYM36_011193 [Artemia franciscana]KAK2712423.1 hypothetical protein QYM36_011193 [Artemia franciscana]
MGIEQSTGRSIDQKSQPRSQRGRTLKSVQSITSERDVEGRSSPGPSIISEPDVPYISYTANKPISSGDSPISKKKSHPAISNLRRSRSETRQPSIESINKKGGIVTVSKPTILERSISDTDLSRLQALPLLLPVIKSSISSTYSRDNEIMHSLDTPAWQKIALSLEATLRKSATETSSEQQRLGLKIRQIDETISLLMHQFSERQKVYSRAAERFSRVGEINHSLSKCEMNIKYITELSSELNALLPDDEKLEPLIWSSG